MSIVNCSGGSVYEIRKPKDKRKKCEICGKKTGFIIYQGPIIGYAHPLCATKMKEHERGSKEK